MLEFVSSVGGRPWVRAVCAMLILTSGCTETPEEAAKRRAAEEALDRSTELVPTCTLEAVQNPAEGILIVGWRDQSVICSHLVEALGQQPETRLFRAVLKAAAMIAIDRETKTIDEAYQLAAILEARGKASPDRAIKTVELVWSLFRNSRGRVSPKDLNVQLRNLPRGLNRDSDERLIALAQAILQAKKARGD
jgi:hypothetical protein